MKRNSIRAIVYTGLTQAQERDLFVHQYDNTTKLSPAEKYYAMLGGDDPDQRVIRIDTILHLNGFKVAKRGSDPRLKKINNVAKMIEKAFAAYAISYEDGDNYVNWHYSLLKTTNWILNASLATQKAFITGLYEVWAKHSRENTLDEATKNLINVMLYLGPDAIKHESNKFLMRKSNFEKRISDLLLMIADNKFIVVPNKSYIANSAAFDEMFEYELKKNPENSDTDEE